MFLKRIELFGFKTFPERTVITFEGGVTAIVGPNGCGKSNISDAVKWVLGATSVKSLRGSSMQDVIFNGTDSLKPLSMAEVSIVLDNEAGYFDSEYTELIVTRRVYRTGEGEYLINKKKCRLKDVHDLFMDTGLGADAYAVIEQGKMDRLIQSKPEERRAVFEEAAGITKYKARRKEALRKLERTKDNLLRLNDIIEEVRKQLGSLKRQANKAKRYKEFQQELKNLDFYLAKDRIFSLETEGKDISQVLEANSLQEQEILKEISQAEAGVEEKKIKIIEFEEELKQKQQEFSNICTNIQLYEKQMIFNKDKITEIENNKQNFEIEIESTGEKILGLEDEIKGLKQDIINISLDLEKKESFFKEKEEKIISLNNNIFHKKDEIKDLKEELLCLINKEANYNKDIEILNQKKNEFELKLVDLDNKLEQGIEKEAVIKEKQEKIKTEIDSYRLFLHNLERKKKELKEKQDILEKQIEDITLELSAKKSKLSSVKSQYELLIDMKNRYEGFSKGVKEIMQGKNKGNSVYFSVINNIASIIEVEKGYEIAIEAALNMSVQGIIVNSPDDAYQIIQHLKDNDLGRVTFFPVEYNYSVIQTEKIDNAICAIDIVKADSSYEKLIKMFFSNIFIVDDMNIAKRILPNLNEKSCVVTKDGEVLSLFGGITGGTSGKKESGLIKRDAQIKELKQEIEKLEKLTTNLDSQLFEMKNNLTLVRQDILKNNSDIENQIKTLNLNTGDLAKLELEYQHNEEFLFSIKQETGKIKNGILEDENKRSDITNKIEVLKVDAENIDNKLKEQNEILFQQEQKKEDCNKEITDYKIEFAQIKEKKSNLDLRCHRVNFQINDEMQRKDKLKNEIALSLERKDALILDIENIEKTLLSTSEEKTFVESHLNKIADEKSLLVDENIMQEAMIKELRKKYNEVQKLLKEKEIKSKECEMQITNIKERLYENYECDWNQVLAYEIPEINIEEVNIIERIELLRKKMNSIGPVNLVAIEECAEKEERYEFLTKQYDDLIKAKESLLTVISTINKESKKKFKETFEAISANFKELFKALFGGGRAELSLLDEENILESGIEIYAAPPGKKPQSTTMLSGGEQALTGIALLFSMFRVKPSPFCFLDEIDAPLDDMNIGKFANIIEEFKKQTQFVIITHSKKTMAKSDMLYGITMEKSGVSKVISIKLVEFQDVEKIKN